MSGIMDKLRHWGRPWAAGSEPVEIHRALLEDVDSQVVAIGGGRRVFPFDRVEVKLLAANPEEKTRLEAIVQNGWNLEREIRERLKAQGARVPEGLAVAVLVTEERTPDFGERHYALGFRKAEIATTAATTPTDPESPSRSGARPSLRPALRLTIVKGQAVRESYDFNAERIYLGRLEEVVDTAGRVKRRNDVAFLEEGEHSQTVSREHARIAWDKESGAYWLRDEGSASGTLLFRAGRSIEVSRHDRRGVRLEDGDEVYLGRAAVRLGIGGERSPGGPAPSPGPEPLEG
jgi:pSer/pThr/pTyr-binding forkhead associated (FHA) protein